jgi:uncharacterized protein (DUF4415 family)
MAKTATSRSAGLKRNTSSSSTPRAKALSVSLQRGEPVADSSGNIRRASLDEIRKMDERGELHATPPDAPTIELGDWFWKNAELLMPGDKPKASVHLRIDYDVFDWFRRQGKGHLTRMNAVLRAYYEANRKRAS